MCILNVTPFLSLSFSRNQEKSALYCLHYSLIYAQFIPLIGLAILIFTLIEAAGNANYVNLPSAEEGEKVDNRQLTSAKIMQRTSVLIMPMVLATFIVGTFSEYNQVQYISYTTLNTEKYRCISKIYSTLCLCAVHDMLAELSFFFLSVRYNFQ